MLIEQIFYANTLHMKELKMDLSGHHRQTHSVDTKALM